jgi:peroxiredoxin
LFGFFAISISLAKRKIMSKISFAGFVGLFFLSTLGSDAWAVNTNIPVSATDVHPLAVGQTVPDGSLMTIAGKKVNFQSLIIQKPSVVIFYRGGWCPYCNLQMGRLVQLEPQLQKLGYQILAISPDKPEKLKESLDKHQINYILLSDRTMELTEKFGLAYRVNQQTLSALDKNGKNLDSNTGNSLHMLPVPAAYVVDTQGVIHFVYYNPDITVRVNPADLLKAAQEAK